MPFENPGQICGYRSGWLRPDIGTTWKDGKEDKNTEFSPLLWLTNLAKEPCPTHKSAGQDENKEWPRAADYSNCKNSLLNHLEPLRTIGTVFA